MNPIDLLEPELSARLIQTLGHFLWEGAAVVAALIVVWPMLRLTSSDLRYRACLAAMAILAAFPVLTFVALQPVSSSPAPAPAAYAQLDREPIRLPHLVEPVPAPALTPGRATRSNQTDVATFDHKRSLYQSYLLMAYFAGVALMLARLAFAVGAVHRLRRTAAPANDATLLAAVARASEAVGLRVAPLVAVCARAAAPAVVGVVRPIILLPLSVATELSPQQLEAILAHEMAHLHRGDHLVLVLQRLIESLLFFHPAVWFISRRLSVERENCCDDMVVAAGGGPVIYANSLVRVAELCREREGAMALASTSTTLSRRVRRLLDRSLPERLCVGRGGILMLLAAAIAALALSVPTRVAARDDDPVAAPATASQPTTRPSRSDSNRAMDIDEKLDLPALLAARTQDLMALEKSLKEAREELAEVEAVPSRGEQYTAQDIARVDPRMMAKLQSRDELALQIQALRAQGFAENHPQLRQRSVELALRDEQIKEYDDQFNQRYFIKWKPDGQGGIVVEKDLRTLKETVKMLQQEYDREKETIARLNREHMAATRGADDDMVAAGADAQAIVAARTQDLMALEKSLKEARQLLAAAEKDRQLAQQGLTPKQATPQEIAEVDPDMARQLDVLRGLELRAEETSSTLGERNTKTLEVVSLTRDLKSRVDDAAKNFNLKYFILRDPSGGHARVIEKDPALLRERVRQLEEEYNSELQALKRISNLPKGRAEPGDASAAGPAEAVEVEDCVVSPQRLASGVTVSASQGEGGGYAVKLSGPAAARKYFVVRGASFYGLRDAPGVVLVHDRRAANEDAIVVLDLLRPGSNPVRIGHDDSGSYLHLHFGRPRVSGTQITFIESEWAGDEQDSPRSRKVTVSLRPPLGKEAVGTWETSGRSP